jgi:hypothetical protein
MRDGDDESDLRTAFAALRREDATEAPAFEALVARARPPGGRRGLVPLLGGLAAVSAIAVVLAVTAGRRPGPAPSPAASIEQWIAPTDFLLRTPGYEILQTTPRIGAPPVLALAEGAALSGPRPK